MYFQLCTNGTGVWHGRLGNEFSLEKGGIRFSFEACNGSARTSICSLGTKTLDYCFS